MLDIFPPSKLVLDLNEILLFQGGSSLKKEKEVKQKKQQKK